MQIKTISAPKITECSESDLWFVTVKINNLEYQERFNEMPSDNQVSSALDSFKFNYSNLTKSESEPK